MTGWMWLPSWMEERLWCLILIFLQRHRKGCCTLLPTTRNLPLIYSVLQLRQSAAISMSAADSAKKVAAGAAVALPLLLGATDAEALTSKDVRSLTYQQVSQNSCTHPSKWNPIIET